MSKTSKIDMVGKRFGILTVISEVEERNKNGHILYNVICDCGKTKQVLGSSLRTGGSKSCNSCYLLTGTHGMWQTREFKIWSRMIYRCNPKHSEKKSNKNYSKRGIKVCDRWLTSFSNFYNDMGNAPTIEHSLDRIDVNGDYYPENCRWATAKQQARNRTNNNLFTYKDVTKCASEWCEEYNMATSTFYNRVKRG